MGRCGEESRIQTTGGELKKGRLPNWELKVRFMMKDLPIQGDTFTVARKRINGQ
jgi:hypothetical protein